MKSGQGRDASARNITNVSISPAARPSTPPVYRPQPTPKVLQRKVMTIAPAQLPVTQSKVRPAPPKVLQATTIQRAADNKWATTAVASFKRSKNKIEKATGYSGSGKETGRLLSQIGTEASEKFLRILRCAKSIKRGTSRSHYYRFKVFRGRRAERGHAGQISVQPSANDWWKH